MSTCRQDAGAPTPEIPGPHLVFAKNEGGRVFCLESDANLEKHSTLYKK